MEKIKPETFGEYMSRLITAAKTLTPDQINACAWVMGASGCGWTKDGIVVGLTASKTYDEQDR